MPTMTKKKEPTEVLYVELPAKLKQELARLAEEDQRKLRVVVKMALEHYLQYRKAKGGSEEE